ncbi:MAG: dTDP-4-amino-4,6-dideoxygalactose transaminase [Candidatus Cloacimonetes bacterium]|nr:dTDP-4-amino-4,6-dideoxygalactose transaminase [Candidatus Cloacimonadota bacterium]
MNIPFNKPYFTGNELIYMKDAIERGHISGNGYYTKLCQQYFQNRYGFAKCLLTSSCTDALEMAAILLNIQPGDEVIMPSYTFVSTANAFVLRGAKIVFCDSRSDHPGMDETLLEGLITPKTKAIVPVHYAGVACDMDMILQVASQYGIPVIEDAAQAIDSFYKGKPLGSFGQLACFSFHETKNISAGEGGLLVVNDPALISRAEIIWEKGTNRAAFFRGEIDKYGWVDIGSSFLPSDMIAAFLWAQLEHLLEIQTRRKQIWKLYREALADLPAKLFVNLPFVPDYATNNAHMFYLTTADAAMRNQIISKLKSNGILAIFHYLALNNSPFYRNVTQTGTSINSEHYTDCLLRLPLYYELPDDIPAQIAELLNSL